MLLFFGVGLLTLAKVPDSSFCRLFTTLILLNSENNVNTTLTMQDHEG
jgi:hypothetical protein